MEDSTQELRKQLETDYPDLSSRELRSFEEKTSDRVNIDSESLEQGLLRLILSLVEFIRKLLEKQAVRRMEGGHLSPEEVEAVGLALLKLEEKMDELKAHFGLKEDDLNLGFKFDLR